MKQSKIKKVKKAIKSTKTALVFKKGKPNKVDKKIKNKSLPASGVKPIKALPKVAKKKTIEKPAPAKKVVAPKKIIKSSKPLKKVELKKTLGKTIQSGKNANSSNGQKQLKEIVKKTIALVTPVKKSTEIKPLKSSKEDKAGKKGKLNKDQKNEKVVLAVKPVKKSKGGRKPKNKNDDDDEPIIENDILIEQLINSTKRLKKPSKIPKQLRTFTNPMASLTVAKLIDTNKKGTSLPKKEPKGKFELEYVMHTSAGILYEFLTSPSGLAEWFADDVNIHDGIFTFFWEGSEQKAKLLGFKEDKFVRLQWLDKPDGTYFEFRIERDELTGDISLIISDFADEGADLKTSKLLWDSQINQLLHVIGSY